MTPDVAEGVVALLVRVPLGLAHWFPRVLLLDRCHLQVGVYRAVFRET